MDMSYAVALAEAEARCVATRKAALESEAKMELANKELAEAELEAVEAAANLAEARANLAEQEALSVLRTQNMTEQ